MTSRNTAVNAAKSRKVLKKALWKETESTDLSIRCATVEHVCDLYLLQVTCKDRKVCSGCRTGEVKGGQWYEKETLDFFKRCVRMEHVCDPIFS